MSSCTFCSTGESCCSVCHSLHLTQTQVRSKNALSWKPLHLAHGFASGPWVCNCLNYITARACSAILALCSNEMTPNAIVCSWPCSRHKRRVWTQNKRKQDQDDSASISVSTGAGSGAPSAKAFAVPFPVAFGLPFAEAFVVPFF